MPPINEYKCNVCDLELEQGWGYCFYVEDDDGKRIQCMHPIEEYCVEQVLGNNPPIELITKRTGFNSDCICLECLFQFQADLGEIGWSPYENQVSRLIFGLKFQKDERECPKCSSNNIKTIEEIVGKSCPKCVIGIIEEIWTGCIA